MTTRLGRHRSPVRAKSPMTVLSEAVSTNASTVSRRSAVFAASSGLLVTMGLPAVGAATSPAPERAEAAPTTELTAVPAAAPIAAAPAATTAFAPVGTVTAVDTTERDRAARATAEAEAAAERAAAQAATERSTASSSASRGGGERESAQGGSTASARVSAPVSAPVSASGSAAVDLAARYTGVPYVYGGSSPSGFDCSGFVQYVYGQLGVSLPRTSGAQSQAGTRVSASEARPGDIVSFLGSGGVYHNGIYTGDGRMIDAPRSGGGVSERAIWSSDVMFTRVG